VLLPEVNLGQLLLLLRGQFLIDIEGYNRVRGKPFTIAEIAAQAEKMLGVTND
jgi:2-oxoglutarate ferredoxin oxidoreductase subunit alpha